MGKQLQRSLRSYWGLIFLSVCSLAIMYVPQPLFNTLSQEFGTDKATVGLLVGVFMLSLGIAPLCVGAILGRVGIARTIYTASILFGLSGFGFLFAPSFSVVLGLRIAQAMLIPFLLTAIMTCISKLFRHFDLTRALSGYVTFALVGALTGRILGGLLGQLFGWRITIASFCFVFFLVLFLLRDLPQSNRAEAKFHSLREYSAVFRVKAVPSLIIADACGLFVFAAVGNVLAFRMAELGYGHSESMIGLMYIGYSIGLFISGFLPKILTFFGKAIRMLIAGSLVYCIAIVIFALPSLWAIFIGLWCIAAGQFMVHALAPGLVNRLATKEGLCDRGLVNGLFLSCFYTGGLLGSYFPIVFYTHLGWIACILTMLLVQVLSLCIFLRVSSVLSER